MKRSSPLRLPTAACFILCCLPYLAPPMSPLFHILGPLRCCSHGCEAAGLEGHG